jgi:hypothetical protein
MGLFSPKYPTSDTPGATGTPAARESRADRKQREYIEVQTKRLADTFDRLHDEMAERDARRKSR